VTPSPVATTAALCALSFLVRRRDPVETHAAAADAPAPKFLDRLPSKLTGGALWAVEAEDHYLRLHTSLGSDLILMRLGDAIAELEGIEGARTHRSWWVARDAVRRVERDDGRVILHLPDGVAAPVSRAYAKLLRAAGWF
jgi:DNA-binding LytR/AlgR family response regulator